MELIRASNTAENSEENQFMVFNAKGLSARLCSGLLIAILASSCLGQKRNTRHPGALKARSESVQYFPPGVFNVSNPSDSDATAAVFSEFLESLNEPSLIGSNSANGNFYRLTILSFPEAKAVTLRLSIHSDDAGDLITKIGIHGKLTSQQNNGLSAEQVSSFLALIKEANFWTAASASGEGEQVDGQMWALEAHKNGVYHIVYRYNPKPSCYTQAGKFLLTKIAGIEFGFPDFTCGTQ
jgi:hypothetical protein